MGTAALAAICLIPGALSGPASAGSRPAGAAAQHAGPGAQHVGSGAQGATIVRSAYGVPTITAGSTAGMWFGAGWAQAQDRMVQLELTRRAVEGTLSAILGSGALPQDEAVRRLFYTSQELTAQYQSLPAATKAAVTAFANGINAYEASAYSSAASAQEKVPYEFFALGKLLGMTGPYRPAPWRPVDTMAVGNYLARQFGGGGGSDLQRRPLDR